MKKFLLFASISTISLLAQGFVSRPAEKQENPDWIIEVTEKGISVINDGRNCIDITVDVIDFHATWSNCPPAP